MKKFLISVLTAISLVACSEEKSDKPTITIGASLPLSGDLSMYGNALKKSLDLAIKDSKNQDLKYNYKIVVEDDRYDLKPVLTNMNRFKSVNKANAVMSFWGAAGTVVSDWAEKSQTIHMSCAASDRVGVGYYNFNHATQPKTLKKRILKYYRDNNFKKIGIVYLQALEIQEFINVFVPELKSNGFDVVFVTPVNSDARDLNVEIQKMKAKSPDVIEVLMQSPSLNVFGKQAKEQGLNVPMSSINNLITAPEEFEGQAFVTEDTGLSSFTEHFESLTGVEQVGCVVNFYDGLNMLIYAYENTPLRDGEVIPNNEDVAKTLLNIKNTDFKSVISEISVDKEGNIDSPAVLKRLKNGKPVIVEK